jgi:hypothetical protein
MFDQGASVVCVCTFVPGCACGLGWEGIGMIPVAVITSLSELGSDGPKWILV